MEDHTAERSEAERMVLIMILTLLLIGLTLRTSADRR